MRRLVFRQRDRWQEIVESKGFDFHTVGDRPYWNEAAAYAFTAGDLEALESATEELQRLCMLAAQFVIDHERFADLQIPVAAIPLIKDSWARETPSVYGRFDLAYRGVEPPKLLEYNAQTPTSLFEAGAIQWLWKEAVFPDNDQFNSLEPKLIAQWKACRPYLPGTVYFSALPEAEDQATCRYLASLAEAAEIPTRFIDLGDLGWLHGRFVDLENQTIENVFALYPWEWLMAEQSNRIAASFSTTTWIEPAWKMLWSNKAILAILWELFPGHPNLLEAHINTPAALQAFVRKPIYSREGANVAICGHGISSATGGQYGSEGYVFQELAELANIDGKYAVVGSWYVTDQGAAGIGIRESDGPITDKTAQFVPHFLE
jgi:glutathionylspermidine synthase